jgi:hypothetical protein
VPQLAVAPQQVPTAQSEEVEQWSPMSAVPLQRPAAQLPETQSLGAAQTAPFAAPATGMQVDAEQRLDLQSNAVEQVVPSAPRGSQTIVVPPWDPDRLLHCPMAQAPPSVHAARHTEHWPPSPAWQGTLAQPNPAPQSASAVQACVQAPQRHDALLQSLDPLQTWPTSRKGAVVLQ